jgi:hypothetical protein
MRLLLFPNGLLRLIKGYQSRYMWQPDNPTRTTKVNSAPAISAPVINAPTISDQSNATCVWIDRYKTPRKYYPHKHRKKLC